MAAPLPLLQAFGIGVAGAFVVYCLLYRESRVADFIKNPGKKWPLLVIDLLLYLTCGGLSAAFFGEPRTYKDAFTSGCAWQGIIGSVMAGAELEAYRKAHKDRRRSKAK